jgi:hypothetical protein
VRIIAGEQAEPPMMVRRMVLNLRLLSLHMGEQAKPDRGHTSPNGNALGLEQVMQALAVEVRSREHQLGADDARDVGQAPTR